MIAVTGKAFVIVDGTPLRIDRIGMATGRDRPHYPGKHNCHGINVQVIADPAGRLIWASPALPGARHAMGAERDHGILDTLHTADVRMIADTAIAEPIPHSRFPNGAAAPTPTTDATGRCPDNQHDVNTAHARQRGEANAQTPSSRAGRTSTRSGATPPRNRSW